MGEFDLETFLPYQLAVSASRVSRGFETRYRKKFGITMPEWRVVAHLSQAERVSVRDIHARADMEKSKVSRAASRLEKAGFLRKATNSTDRRLVELSLTAKGRAMVAEIVPLAHAYERDVLALVENPSAFLAALRTLQDADP